MMASYTPYPATSALNVYHQQSASSSSNAAFELDPLVLRRGETKIRAICEIEDDVEIRLENYPEINVEKPPVSRLLLIAIWQSPHKRLRLREIYEAIEARYPDLSQKQPWKASVENVALGKSIEKLTFQKATIRHTLWKKVGFTKLLPPGATGSGYGGPWTFALMRDEDVPGPLKDRPRRALKNSQAALRKKSKSRGSGMREIPTPEQSLLQTETLLGIGCSNAPSRLVLPTSTRPPYLTPSTSEWDVSASGMSVSQSYELLHQSYLCQGYRTYPSFPPAPYVYGYANDVNFARENHGYSLNTSSYPYKI
ncbi:hypothetical protein CVT24_011929 [Panaeolus cyanescens]|uniref:Fork-head domain-containing protein n=1 Tax=Panaeolus cyanescens TaxID=181874 RepID=A0A409VXR6_9AGAR|nr:hypothetical protein CVT24_011929 [Panaeolus cyanescens]